MEEHNEKPTADGELVPEIEAGETMTADETEQEGTGETDTTPIGNGATDSPATLEAEQKESQEKLLRLAAEFENYKKRMVREQESFFKYAEEGLLKELLPSLDNLERALAHQNASENTQVLREGVELTLKALLSATAKFGLSPIDSVGQPFDPNLHEALVMEASATIPPQSVIREFERGYFYKDRLLRAAKVVVSKGCE